MRTSRRRAAEAVYGWDNEQTADVVTSLGGLGVSPHHEDIWLAFMTCGRFQTVGVPTSRHRVFPVAYA